MNSTLAKKERSSNIELFRIITMLLIVAHHYVVNSGIINEVVSGNVSTGNSIFLLLFGWGGKTGINCFVLITGYFMCTSKISLKKFLKLFLEREFYAIIIILIFILTGYTSFSIGATVKTIFPFFKIDKGFTTAYILFFCFIPFVNILVKNMSKKQHGLLILLSLTIYTILPSFFATLISFNYITWFTIIYLMGAYIRLYPTEKMNSAKFTGGLAIASLFLSWLSVIVCFYATKILPDSIVAKLCSRYGSVNIPYFFVADSNKILAVFTAVSCFLFFKNAKLKYNKCINRVAASCFGVFLIHANSSSMRNWLWGDVCRNVKYINSPYVILHAVFVVLAVYSICTVIDMLRIKFIEKTFFKGLDKYLK